MSITLQSPTGGGSLTLTEPTTSSSVNQNLVAVNGTLAPLVNGTSWTYTTTIQNIDFTGIPSWVKRITIIFSEVSLSGTDNILVQLGTASGIENTGYVSAAGNYSSTATATTSVTNGMVIRVGTGTFTFSGVMQLHLLNGNTWVSSHSGKGDGNSINSGGGSKTLSGTLTQLTVTRTGINSFDAGSINIIYE